MILRASRLPLFMLCPGSHVDADPERDRDDEPSEPAALGIAVHHLLESYLLFDLFEAEFVEEIAEKHSTKDYTIDAGELAFLFRNGTKGWESIKPHFGDGALAVEERKTLNITKDILLTVKADVASANKAVGEYKSGRKEHVAEWQVQAGGRLCGAQWGFLVWLREQAIDTYRLLTPEEFDAKIKTQCERYHAGERTVGDHCFSLYCPKADTCPALIADFNGKTGKFLPAIAETYTLLAPEQVAAAYRMARMMEQGLKRFWPSLNLYLDRHGQLPIGNGDALVRRDTITSKIDSSLALPIIEKYVPAEQVPNCFAVVKENLKGQIGLVAEPGKKAQRVRDCMKELEAAGALVYERGRARQTIKESEVGDAE